MISNHHTRRLLALYSLWRSWKKKRETFENRLVCSPKLSCADIILIFSGPLSPVQIAITLQITEQHPRTTQPFSAHHSQSRVAAWFECMLSGQLHLNRNIIRFFQFMFCLVLGLCTSFRFDLNGQLSYLCKSAKFSQGVEYLTHMRGILTWN